MYIYIYITANQHYHNDNNNNNNNDNNNGAKLHTIKLDYHSLKSCYVSMCVDMCECDCRQVCMYVVNCRNFPRRGIIIIQHTMFIN